jgi:hypothetical protein
MAPARLRAYLRTTRGQIMAAVVAAGAVLGLLTNVVDLWGRIFPDTPVVVTIRPGKDPQLNIRAERWAVDHPTTFRGEVPVARAGTVYSVQVRAEGLDGETPALEWVVHDDFTGQPAEPFPWAPPSLEFEPDDDPWTDTLEVFVPVPPVTRMRVIFTVVHDDKVVATARTDAISVGGAGR